MIPLVLNLPSDIGSRHLPKLSRHLSRRHEARVRLEPTFTESFLIKSTPIIFDVVEDEEQTEGDEQDDIVWLCSHDCHSWNNWHSIRVHLPQGKRQVFKDFLDHKISQRDTHWHLEIPDNVICICSQPGEPVACRSRVHDLGDVYALCASRTLSTTRSARERANTCMYTTPTREIGSRSGHQDARLSNQQCRGFNS
jgi:hypothetical protein